jgi:hypothetical protein
MPSKSHRGGVLILWGNAEARFPEPAKGLQQLFYRSRLGQKLVLDDGPGIDPASVAVSRDGAHAYWTRDGIATTATLP